MAATHVEITRQEFEDWLFELCPVFERDEEAVGRYFCPLSRHVAVKVSTTLGAGPVRRERCRMSFVSRPDRRELWKQQRASQPSCTSHERTEAWRKDWEEGLRGMFAAFKNDREHYNKVGARTQDEYAAEWTARIESVPGWNGFAILTDLRATLAEGKWLTGKQEQAVLKFLHPQSKQGRKPSRGGSRKPTASSSVPAPAPAAGKPDTALLEGLNKLVAAAQEADDKWTVKFATGDVRRRAERGTAPSPRQAEILREKFTKYRLAVPAAIAA